MEKYTDVKLSDNFMLSEFIHSNHANINTRNIMDIDILPNIKYVVDNILVPIRRVTNSAIIINSCYRSKSINDLVKGAVNSAHLKALAVDITNHNADYNYNLLLTIINFRDKSLLERITKIIVYVPGNIGYNTDIKWLHVEYDKQCVPGRVPKIFNCDISKKKKTYVEIPISSLKYAPF